MAKLPSGLRRRFDLLLDDVGNYILCFGFSRGSRLFLYRTFRRGPGKKTVLASVPGTEVKLSVRLDSSDVGVFVDTFHRREHDWGFTKDPQIIVDCGAYTGLSPVYFAINFPGARVIAVESSEENFALLAKNVSAFKNIEILNAALWSESGSLEVTDPGRGAWGLTVSKLREHDEAGVKVGDASTGPTVSALTVADIMREYGIDRIDLLKLDIEGSEKEVLSASGPWIDRIEAMSVELHDRYTPGCTRAFFNAAADFPIELYRGEKILVVRGGSPLMSRSGD
jgi:FkbM family methyltransferase